MLALAAAFTLLLVLAQGLRGSDPAVAQASKDKKDDVGTVVAAGDEVEGTSAGNANTSRGAGAMPQTGSELLDPFTVGLVLLLDGALAFLVTTRRYSEPLAPTS